MRNYMERAEAALKNAAPTEWAADDKAEGELAIANEALRLAAPEERWEWRTFPPPSNRAEEEAYRAVVGALRLAAPNEYAAWYAAYEAIGATIAALQKAAPAEFHERHIASRAWAAANEELTAIIIEERNQQNDPQD